MTKPSPDSCAVRPSFTSVRTASRALMPRRSGTVPGGPSATRLTIGSRSATPYAGARLGAVAARDEHRAAAD